MPCGCSDSCPCCLTDTQTVGWTGSGAVGDCYMGTVFLDPEGGFTANALGLSVLIDPASTLPWSLGPDGLLLDCCPVCVVDSATIDFTVTPEGCVTGEVTAVPAAILADAFSPGMMIDYGGAVAPATWLICDGSIQSTLVYPALYAVIGDAFNGGVPNPGGANTFRLPDMRGRASYGVGTHPSVDTIGDEDPFTAPGLVSSRTPNHFHVLPNHDHGPGTLGGTTGGPSASNTGMLAGLSATEISQLESTVQNANAPGPFPGFDLAGNNYPFSAATETHTHDFAVTTGLTDPGGTGPTGTTAIPYLVVNKIIKT